jgi:ATP-binding cassette subfamily F protein uup
LGDLEPDSGIVHHGTKLDVAYFDQTRELLDLEKTVIDNVADGRERIDIAGSSRHVIGYLGDFLFSPDRCRTPVKALSGGERNRLLLAKLFSKPANVLVLDEPTNDLDADTLDLLENAVVEFPGTVLLVSHDRKFLDNVVTSTLVFEGNGVIQSFVGGFTDWLHQGGRLAPMAEENEPIKSTQEEAPKATLEKIKKLSFKEQRELDALPAEITVLEEQHKALQALSVDPLIYMQDNRKAALLLQEILDLEARLESKIERWAKLSENG